MRTRRWAAALSVTLLALLATAVLMSGAEWDFRQVHTPVRPPASAADRAPIKVGAKDFTESLILGHIILWRLEAAGLPVEDSMPTGSTPKTRAALLDGEIDIYAEYTANALVLYHPDVRRQLDPEALKEPGRMYREAARVERRDAGIVWLDAAPADNGWGIAVPRTLAETERLRTIADFARYANAGGRVKLAGSNEFFTRDDALPSMQGAYGFALSPTQKVGMASIDSVTYAEAAAGGKERINAAMAFATDGALDSFGLVMLEDPLDTQLPYQPAPVLREDTYAQYPEVADILAEPFAALTTETLRDLSSRVTVRGQEPGLVAQQWLSANGFLE